MKAVVVGAGPAGLVAARSLQQAGWQVTLIEASDGLGGRVRSDTVEGFRLDHGFQVLLTGYPAVKRCLDLRALKLRTFDRGAIVVAGSHWHELGDPRGDPKALAPTLASPLGTLTDKWRLLRLRRAALRGRLEGDPTAEDFLRSLGFSARFLDHFLRPVFGGMFLDPSLSFSARALLGRLRALMGGRMAVPRDGMQAVADQLAASLTDVRLETPALRLERTSEGAVRGVHTSTELLAADAVVVAAHAPEAQRLTGLPVPVEAHSATCLYFHLPHPLYGHKKVVFSGFRDPFVHFAVQLTNAAASYAPQPEHLLSATVMGVPDLSLEEMAARALADMQRWFPWRSISGLRPLAAFHLPFAQLAQPLGFDARRPTNRTGSPGLYLAGEFTEDGSINGALTSGEKAAQAVLGDIQPSAAPAG